MPVSYEWVIEELDAPDGDILDVNHAATYAEAKRLADSLRADGKPVNVGLVRDRGDDLNGIVCRSWAYIADGALPETFADAGGAEIAKVPPKFARQVLEARP